MHIHTLGRLDEFQRLGGVSSDFPLQWVVQSATSQNEKRSFRIGDESYCGTRVVWYGVSIANRKQNCTNRGITRIIEVYPSTALSISTSSITKTKNGTNVREGACSILRNKSSVVWPICCTFESPIYTMWREIGRSLSGYAIEAKGDAYTKQAYVDLLDAVRGNGCP